MLVKKKTLDFIIYNNSKIVGREYATQSGIILVIGNYSNFI